MFNVHGIFWDFVVIIIFELCRSVANYTSSSSRVDQDESLIGCVREIRDLLRQITRAVMHRTGPREEVVRLTKMRKHFGTAV